ncbi:class I SAM-dependent methyltransferase [Mycobacteroides franklinii]|uniref:class I SAM-dependent methyltransferase n=1 Tax=Mycobacteroides franklinii TaxID=948102 RepID=UPI0012FFC836|nr:class I SAM-dependent methyltransferase [Mycobacteroides franklinii]
MLSLETMVNQNLFICPRCGASIDSAENVWRCASSACELHTASFPVVGGLPALVDFTRSVLNADRLQAVDGASALKRAGLFQAAQRLVHPSNAVAPTAVARMLETLRADESGHGRRPRVLVIGGGTVGGGLEALYADEAIDLIAFDVYVSPVVQFVGDGHAIPLAAGSMDGVIVQAVLEHVVEPRQVAEEIHRVLRSGGIVYADTPFLQQVHEGPYDFTRFTDSGHRYLFRSFERIDSGAVAGAGTALRWSIDYFVRALTRSVRLGRAASLVFFWLSYVDRILDPGHSLDGASSVFFLGRKAAESISESDLIDYYRGGMRKTS